MDEKIIDPLLNDGPYDDYGMNALHNRVIGRSLNDLRIMIRTARQYGSEDEVRVYENILNVKIALGDVGSPVRDTPRVYRGSAAALRGEHH